MAKPAEKRKLLSTQEEAKLRAKAESDPQEALADLKALVTLKAGMTRARRYSLEALESSTKRRIPRIGTRSLDQEFTGTRTRDKMIATSRDLFMNFGFARGLMRQHLKNVIGPGPKLQMRSGDPDFDSRAEGYWAGWIKKCDVRGILTLRGFLRISEGAQLVDGDCGLVLARGGKLQGIEGDRIADPPDEDKAKGKRYESGVEMNREGRPTAYFVHGRKKYGGVVKQATRYDAEDFIHCYLPERFDQVRGLTWMMAALNDAQDLREIIEAVKGKTKLENVLGVAIESDAAGMDLTSLWGGLTSYEATDAQGNAEDRYEVKLGPGLFSFEMQPGEKIQTIQSSTPNQTFEPLTLMLIRIIALTVDMPLEIALQYFTRGSYSAHRSAFLQYYEACRDRREQIEEGHLDRIHRWVMSRAIKAGELDPPKDGADEWAHKWQWRGLPLLDPDKERKADQLSYKLGAESMDDICGRSGRDWEETAAQRIKEIKRIEEMCKKAGVDPSRVLPQVMMPGESARGAINASSGA